MKKVVCLAAVFCTAVAVAMAQPAATPPTGPDPGGPDPTNPLTAPVDGGASLLLAFGATLSAKKLKAFRAQKAA